jgi:glycosyltransferase involved in cell wall biosynthesis
MRIGLDVSPITEKGLVKHRVRGTGVYTRNLKNALLEFDKKNEYIFFTRGEKIPKVEILHYPYFEPFFLSLPILSNYPFIVTVHDLTPLVFSKDFPVGIRGEVKWKIQKFMLSKARRIITDSNSSKKDIIKYVKTSDEKIDVVYLAQDKKFEKKNISEEKLSELRKKYGLPKIFVLYVGDATWNKNLPRIIKACIDINVPLIMVGKALGQENFDRSNPWNRDLREVENLARDNKNIIRIGYLEDDDLVSLYNIADVFLMPSLYEGFGLPILEAMACGCPIITSKEGSLPEVADQAAFFVDPYDIKNISSAISKILKDSSLRKELSHKGIIQSAKFSWKKTAENTIKSYEKALGKG